MQDLWRADQLYSFTKIRWCPAAVDEADSLASLVTDTDDPAAKDCKNYRAVAQNFNVRFLGPARLAVVGPVTVAYRRFGPLDLLAPLTGLQRPLVSSPLLT